MTSDQGVTTTESLRPAPATLDADVQEEIADYFGGDADAHQVAKETIRYLPPTAHTRIDSIVFYRENGERAEISCGTDPATKQRLLNYYLGKRLSVLEVLPDGTSQAVSKRVFFIKRPPGTEPKNPRWRCFVKTGTGGPCNMGLHEASEFLSHLRGFHGMESTNLFPRVIESLQVEAQKEVQPAVLRELGLDPEAFETQIYHCSEKYRDCPRFFDSSQGLAVHRRRDHSEDAPAAARFGNRKDEGDGEPAS